MTGLSLTLLACTIAQLVSLEALWRARSRVTQDAAVLATIASFTLLTVLVLATL